MIRILILLLVWGGLIFYAYRGIKRLLTGLRQPDQQHFPKRKQNDPLRHAKKADVIDIK